MGTPLLHFISLTSMEDVTLNTSVTHIRELHSYPFLRCWSDVMHGHCAFPLLWQDWPLGDSHSGS